MPETPHPEDDPLRSTVDDLEDFKQSRVWHDIKQFLLDRKELIMEEMQDRDLTVERLRHLQGGLQHVNDMLDLPDKFIQEVESYTDG